MGALRTLRDPAEIMELVLYTAAMSRGLIVEWLLEELGLPFQRIVLDLGRGEHKSTAYRRIHPLGAVPALVVDGEPLMESLALALFLADAAPERGLAPPLSSPERGAYLQWMVYATATVEPKLAGPFVRGLSLSPAARRGVATAAERQAFEEVLSPLRDAFARGHVLASGCSAADIVLGAELSWADQVGLLGDAPEARRYLAGLQRRPSWGRLQGAALPPGSAELGEG